MCKNSVLIHTGIRKVRIFQSLHEMTIFGVIIQGPALSLIISRDIVPLTERCVTLFANRTLYG